MTTSIVYGIEIFERGSLKIIPLKFGKIPRVLQEKMSFEVIVNRNMIYDRLTH